VHTVPNQPDGTIKISDLQNAIRMEDVHFPRTKLIALENTHNRCGGVVLTPEYIEEVTTLAKDHNLLVHMDGARIFNAAIKLGVPEKALLKGVDSVTFCLSKGLGAPVGSVLCGNKEFITNARKIRKQLGGGMRQAGILAAAGIIALESMVDRLEEDHQRALYLAEKLKDVPNITIRENSPQTNMVFLDLNESFPKTNIRVIEELKELNVLIGTSRNRGFRLVTHVGITDQDIDIVVKSFQIVMN
jgi:threonine aldolase